MSRLVAVATLFVLLMLAHGGEARVRLNAIRTVILQEGQALPVNRSVWEPSLDMTLYQCMSDLECVEGSYCHTPVKGPAYSRCHTCRRKKRRCHRDGMCCPGNRCSHNICVPDVFESAMVPDGGTKRRRVDVRAPSGQVGDPCLRSSDCSNTLCCARHLWTRICKPVLREGQVCTRHLQKANRGPELFQRCPCGDGLSCQTLQEPNERPASKFMESPTRHSSPHTSLLSLGTKNRLHVCRQK